MGIPNHIKTMGDLMDYANQSNSIKAKTALRGYFQDFCSKSGRTPMNAQTIIDWRNQPVTSQAIIDCMI